MKTFYLCNTIATSLSTVPSDLGAVFRRTLFKHRSSNNSKSLSSVYVSNQTKVEKEKSNQNVSNKLRNEQIKGIKTFSKSV